LLAVTDLCTRTLLAFAILNSSYDPLADRLSIVRCRNSPQITVGSESKKENNAAGCNALLPSHIKLPIYLYSLFVLPLLFCSIIVTVPLLG